MRQPRMILAMAAVAALLGPSASAARFANAQPSRGPAVARQVAGRAEPGVLAQAPVASSAWTPADCRACHEAAVAGNFAHSKHARLPQSCANCHANVVEHMRAQMAGDANGPVPSLKNVAASQIVNTCLTCHEKGNQANWHGGMHERRGLSCASCHSIHGYKSSKAQLGQVSAAEVCFSCHKAYRAKMMRTSHHPVLEGKITCTNCHNPHDGNSPKMISAASVNEKCYECHTEKRGPFLHEHAPVRENCLTCHDPHGTNHDKMLTNKQPYLCQRCHFGGGHPGNLYDLNNTLSGPTVAIAGPPATQTIISPRAVGRECKNCHSQIHGSNSFSGVAFGR